MPGVADVVNDSQSLRMFLDAGGAAASAVASDGFRMTYVDVRFWPAVFPILRSIISDQTTRSPDSVKVLAAVGEWYSFCAFQVRTCIRVCVFLCASLCVRISLDVVCMRCSFRILYEASLKVLLLLSIFKTLSLTFRRFYFAEPSQADYCPRKALLLPTPGEEVRRLYQQEMELFFRQMRNDFPSVDIVSMNSVLPIDFNDIGDRVVAAARVSAGTSGARLPLRLDLNALRVVNWEQQWATHSVRGATLFVTPLSSYNHALCNCSIAPHVLRYLCNNPRKYDLTTYHHRRLALIR